MGQWNSGNVRLYKFRIVGVMTRVVQEYQRIEVV